MQCCFYKVRCTLLPFYSNSLKLFEAQNYINPVNKPIVAGGSLAQRKTAPKTEAVLTLKKIAVRLPDTVCRFYEQCILTDIAVCQQKTEQRHQRENELNTFLRK